MTGPEVSSCEGDGLTAGAGRAPPPEPAAAAGTGADDPACGAARFFACLNSCLASLAATLAVFRCLFRCLLVGLSTVCFEARRLRRAARSLGTGCFCCLCGLFGLALKGRDDLLPRPCCSSIHNPPPTPFCRENPYQFLKIATIEKLLAGPVQAQ